MTRDERRALWNSPCAICGDRGDIEIDHIIARANGGTDEASNRQALCRVCNAIKRDRRTNDEVRAWIAANPEAYARRKEARAFKTRNHYA